MRALTLLAAISVTGCSFVTPGARNTQLALTGLISLDAAQTVTIARSPCLFERNPAAAAEAEADVARKAKWRRLQRVYQWATALGHGLAIHNNVTKNIRPFSSFNCGDAR